MNEVKEIIEHHREACKFYLKIDFGLLAGVVTIFTILKMERLEILKTLFGVRFFISGIAALICYGLIFDRWALAQWSAPTRSESQQKMVLDWLKRGITVQLELHVLFVLLIAVGALSFSGGYVQGYDEFKAIASIQQGVEAFNTENNAFPKTIEDLFSRYPFISKIVMQLGRERVQYAPDETRGYVLRLVGPKRKFGLKLDDIVLDHVSFINEIEEMEIQYPTNSKASKLQ